MTRLRFDAAQCRIVETVEAADGSIVVSGQQDIAVGVISDTQHGSRAGGALHPVATPNPGGVAGFMSATMVDALAAAVIQLGSLPLPAAPGENGYLAVAVAGALGWELAITSAQHGNQAGGALHATATHAAAGFESTDAYDFIHGVVSALSPTSIPTGAGLTTVHVTAALVSANNTSRRCHFELERNGALATLEVSGGDVDLKVSQRNDGTFRVQSLLTGFYVDGAAPTITGTTVSGLAWSATVAAGVVTLQVQQDAGLVRSVTSILRVENLVTQVAP